MAKTTYSREELELQLAESRREFWAADATINNLEMRLAEMAAQLTTAENKCAALAADNEKAMEAMRQADAAVKLAHEKFSALAAENAKLKKFCKDAAFDADYEAELGMERGGFSDAINEIKTPSTDAFLAEVRAQGVEMAMEHMQSSGSLTFGDCYISLNEFADQLRKGCNHTEQNLDKVDHFGDTTKKAMLHCSEPETDNTNQQFESLGRGDK